MLQDGKNDFKATSTIFPFLLCAVFSVFVSYLTPTNILWADLIDPKFTYPVVLQAEHICPNLTLKSNISNSLHFYLVGGFQQCQILKLCPIIAYNYFGFHSKTREGMMKSS